MKSQGIPDERKGELIRERLKTEGNRERKNEREREKEKEKEKE